MAILLALETSSSVCSVALLRDGNLLGSSELRLEKSHSSHITVLIQQLLANTGFSEKDLSAVAVSGGPGSYTGLRIGTSTAKGLCYALDIPLLAVSTLQVLAWQVRQTTPAAASFQFCPMLDARRMEVYTALYSDDLAGIVADEALVLEPDSWQEALERGPVLFFGSGAPKWEKFMTPHANAFFLNNVLPSAVAVAELSWEKFKAGQFENTAYYEPFYVKEVHITKPAAKI